MFRRPSLPIAVALCIAVIALACVPVVLSPYAVKFTTRVLVLAIMVISLDLLIGITGLVSFGHAAFFALGAYAVYFVSPESESANALVVLAAGATLAAAGAFVIGVFAMLTRGFYFIMVTLAAGQMVFSIFYDTDIAKGSDGAYVNVKPDLTIGGSTLLDFDNRRQFFYVCLILLAATYLFLLWLVRSRFGRVLQGIRINEQRMRALGYDTYRYRLAVFVIAGAIAGIAGALFACIDGFVTPELASWRESGLAIMMVVLGGTGTLYGAVIGAFAYSVLEEILKSASMVGPFVAEHWRFGMGVALAAAVLGAPRGLAGLFQSRTWRAPAPIGTDFVHRDFARPERRAHTLSIRDLARHFGGLRAVDGVSLELQANFVHAIIGPNGAGKTTLINLLSGELKPSGGKVYLDELDITGSPPHRIARAGVGRSFQRTNVFGDFTVRDNCALAAEARAVRRSKAHRTCARRRRSRASRRFDCGTALERRAAPARNRDADRERRRPASPRRAARRHGARRDAARRRALARSRTRSHDCFDRARYGCGLCRRRHAHRAGARPRSRAWRALGGAAKSGGPRSLFGRAGRRVSKLSSARGTNRPWR